MMRAIKYETKIRKMILKYSLITIMIMLTIMVVILSLYNTAIRDSRLQNTLDDYNLVLKETMESFENSFYDENKDLLVKYLAKEVSDNHMYRAFYTFNANQAIKSDLMVFNNDLDYLLTTNSMFEDNISFENFINIIVNNGMNEEFNLVNRIYKGIDNEMYLLMVKPITEGDHLLGYTVSIVSGREFLHHSDENTAHYAITDRYNNVLMASTDMIIDNRDKLILSQFERNNVFSRDYQYKTTIVTDNISVYSFIPTENHFFVLTITIIGIIIITLFIVLQSNYFSRKISQRIGQSLYDLQDEMSKINHGYNKYISIETEDEFEDLADKINFMLSELRASHAENLTLNDLYLETEKKKLEAQFNPHFLANTLETIRSAMYIDKNISDQMLQDLNHILRYSIDESIMYTTLEEDIKYLIHYLSINKHRYEDFNYNIHYDSRLKNLNIPKLFLLPLIENSLKYGFKYRRDLKIKLSVIKRNDVVIFRIIDNGGALDTSETRKINKRLEKPEKIKNQHGLKNTKQRITMLYPSTTFKIFNKLSCTVVEIRIEGANYV